MKNESENVNSKYNVSIKLLYNCIINYIHHTIYN